MRYPYSPLVNHRYVFHLPPEPLAGLALLNVAALSVADTQPAERPNVIAILTDV